MLLRHILHGLGTLLVSGPALYSLSEPGNLASLAKWRDAAFDAFSRRYLPQPRLRRRRLPHHHNMTAGTCPNPTFIILPVVSRRSVTSISVPPLAGRWASFHPVCSDNLCPISPPIMDIYHVRPAGTLVDPVFMATPSAPPGPISPPNLAVQAIIIATLGATLAFSVTFFNRRAARQVHGDADMAETPRRHLVMVRDFSDVTAAHGVVTNPGAPHARIAEEPVLAALSQSALVNPSSPSPSSAADILGQASLSNGPNSALGTPATPMQISSQVGSSSVTLRPQRSSAATPGATDIPSAHPRCSKFQTVCMPPQAPSPNWWEVPMDSGVSPKVYPTMQTPAAGSRAEPLQEATEAVQAEGGEAEEEEVPAQAEVDPFGGVSADEIIIGARCPSLLPLNATRGGLPQPRTQTWTKPTSVKSTEGGRKQKGLAPPQTKVAPRAGGDARAARTGAAASKLRRPLLKLCNALAGPSNTQVPSKAKKGEELRTAKENDVTVFPRSALAFPDALRPSTAMGLRQPGFSARMRPVRPLLRRPSTALGVRQPGVLLRAVPPAARPVAVLARLPPPAVAPRVPPPVPPVGAPHGRYTAAQKGKGRAL
ncbi:hypothetical protein B0H15DRAFT_429526 [Mycena belliarum]|uniref:Uncharacterized protein n=1 Tax=Mycena belliarum TaxID=1033014 RepID=A0AAD6TXP6_9AGAR|nr:hypothetical protein B0H15DRAFT_429526 [Mycena belliae]